MPTSALVRMKKMATEQTSGGKGQPNLYAFLGILVTTIGGFATGRVHSDSNTDKIYSAVLDVSAHAQRIEDKQAKMDMLQQIIDDRVKKLEKARRVKASFQSNRGENDGD